MNLIKGQVVGSAETQGTHQLFYSSAFLSSARKKRNLKMGTHYFQHLLGICVFLLLIPQGHGDFIINSKAVLQKCTDQWTLKETQRVPRLSKMTVCLDMRLLTIGKWMAFSYTIPRSPSYELALQGDGDAVYAWLQGVQHRFPVRLTPERWHRLCLHIDSARNRFGLTVNSSKDVHEHMVSIKALRPSGNLQLGFHPRVVCPGSSMATIELHLFRIWGDIREHFDCEDGTIVSWDSNLWRISRSQTWVQDNTLSCKHYTTTTTKVPVPSSTIRSTTSRTAHNSATKTSATTSRTSSMRKNVKSTNDTPKGSQSSSDSTKRSSNLPNGVTSMTSTSKATQPTKNSSSLATSVKYTTPKSKGTQPTKSPSTIASTVTSASYAKGSTSSKGSTFKPNAAIVTVPSLIKTSTPSTPLIKDMTTNPSPTKALARVTNVSMATTKAVTTSNAAQTNTRRSVTHNSNSDTFTTTFIHEATKDTTRQATHTSVSTPSTTTNVIPSNGIIKDNTRNISHNITSNVELTTANNTPRNKPENTTLKTSTPRKAVTSMDTVRTTIHRTSLNPLPTVKFVNQAPQMVLHKMGARV